MQLTMKHGLPPLLVLMAVAVILILSGATGVGLTFGFVVAGLAGVLLVSAVLQDVKQSTNRARARDGRLYRAPHVRGY